ncbi:MAG: glycosyltransferase family 4 protein, partial [Candidatus Woesearchaeota archaeon]
MKILFVLDYYYPYQGGSEVLFRNLAEGLAAKGYDVTVVTSRFEGTKRRETIAGVKVRRISVPPFIRRPFFMLLALPWLLFNAKRFDIIHTTSCGSSVSAWIASRLLRIPAVITVHEVLGKDWDVLYGKFPLVPNLSRVSESMALSLPFDRHICVSHSTKKNLSRLIDKRRITVVHNAVDHDHWNPSKYKGARKKIRRKLGIKDKEFLYLFYGRPGVTKGVEYLAKALPCIRENVPDSKALFILGTEPKERYGIIKSLLKKNGGGSVILHKPLPYKILPEYIMAADCVVVPSITEGFGFCVAEACSLKRPVVASNTTSIPEVISGKFLLVPPRDPKAIAKAVQYVKEKKYMKTPLKRFMKKDFIQGYENIYE